MFMCKHGHGLGSQICSDSVEFHEPFSVLSSFPLSAFLADAGETRKPIQTAERTRQEEQRRGRNDGQWPMDDGQWMMDNG